MIHRLTPLFFTLCLLVLAACGADSEPRSDRGGWGRESATMPAVEAIQARYGALPLQSRLNGTVRAENQVLIYPEITAPITRVAVQNGDYVQRGAALVYLRDTQFQEQLRQAEATLQINQADAKRAEATLKEVQARLERTEQLADRQLQSAQELGTLQAEAASAEATYAQALARIAQAEATVAEAQEALRQTVVRAPISGYVGQRDAEVGMRVTGNNPLFTLGSLETVRIEIPIADNLIGQVQEGQTALISAPQWGDRVIEASISRISPFLDAATFSTDAEIDVPNPEGLLRPGMFVTVDVLYGESTQAALVPTSALYEDPNTGRLGVYTATSLGTEVPLAEPETYDEDNPPPLTEPTPMAFTEVEVLARGGGVAGITGVGVGDWVVVVGQNLLSRREEARVRPLTWDRVASLQRLQDRDLLRQFMEKQQRLAQESYAAPADEDAATQPREASRDTVTVNPQQASLTP